MKVNSRQHCKTSINHFKKTNYYRALLTPFLLYKCTKTVGVLTIADSYQGAELVTNSASPGAVDTDLAFLSLFRVRFFIISLADLC